MSPPARHRDTGVVDQNVDAAEAQDSGGEGALHLGLVGDVAGDRQALLAELGDELLRLLEVEVGDHHTRTLGGQTPRHGASDPAAAAGDHGHTPAQRLRRRHAAQLGFLERPVLDAKGLLLIEATVAGQDGRAAHHADGVDVELRGDARLALRRGQCEHANTGPEHHHWVGAAHRRRVRGGEAPVPRRVLLAVGVDRRLHLRAPRRRVGVRRQVEEQRRALGAQEVVGARGALRRECGSLLGGDELEDRRVVTEMGDGTAHRAAQPAQQRQHADRLVGPLHGVEVGDAPRTEWRRSAPGLDPRDVRLRPRDEFDGGLVAGARGVAPADQAMSAQNHATQGGMGDGEIAQAQGEPEAGPLPVEPADLVAVDLLHEAPSAGGGSQGDDRVGMDVVDVRGGEQCVQRRVDRRRGATRLAEATREQCDLVVLVLDPAVPAFQGADPHDVQSGQALGAQRAQVAAGGLDPQLGDRLAGDGVDAGHLAAGVAAGKVGDAQVGPEQVAAMDQQANLVIRRHSVVPGAAGVAWRGGGIDAQGERPPCWRTGDWRCGLDHAVAHVATRARSMAPRPLC